MNKANAGRFALQILVTNIQEWLRSLQILTFFNTDLPTLLQFWYYKYIRYNRGYKFKHISEMTTVNVFEQV